MSESLPDTANPFSTSLPIRAISDLPANYQRPGPTRPGNETSVSSSTSMAHPLFGSHPSGDPAYWIAKVRPADWVPPRRNTEPIGRTSGAPPQSSTSLLSKALNSKAAAPSGKLDDIREPSDSSVLSDSSSVSSTSTSEESPEAARGRSSKARRSSKVAKGKALVKPSASRGTSQKDRHGTSSQKDRHGNSSVHSTSATRAAVNNRRTSAAHPGITAYTILGVEEDTPQNKLRRVFRAMVRASLHYTSPETTLKTLTHRQVDKLEAKLKNGGEPVLQVAVAEKISEVKKAYAAVGSGESQGICAGRCMC